MGEMFLYVCLLILANHCYASSPVVFDILNSHHEYKHDEPGTFARVIVVRPLGALMKNQVESFGRSILRSKHFSSDFNIFCTNVTIMSCNYCIPVCKFFLHRFSRHFLRPAKCRPHKTRTDVELICNLYV